MLDLKAKLLAAGLVTADQVKKVEDEEHKKREAREKRNQQANAQKREPAVDSRGPDDREDRAAASWQKRLDTLKAAGKAEQYDAIRGWVDRHRLDNKTAVPSEGATRFHFARSDGSIGHITIEPDVQEKLSAGAAGIIAFMGHNGLEHAAVPADLARDILHVKPEWVRALAGVTDGPDADATATTTEPTTTTES